MRYVIGPVLAVAIALISGCQEKSPDNGLAGPDEPAVTPASRVGAYEDVPSPTDPDFDDSGFQPPLIADAPSPTPTMDDYPAPAPADDPASPASSGSPTVHVVGKGDTMWSLARKYLGDPRQWKRIARANPGIKHDDIPIGTKLLIPSGDSF
jgi:5'-nucleotidase